MLRERWSPTSYKQYDSSLKLGLNMYNTVHGRGAEFLFFAFRPQPNISRDKSAA